MSSLKIRGKPVAVKSIKLGQVWRQDTTGQDHLVTKVYSEVFTQVVKVKVAKSADGVTLPGFSFTQEGAF